MEHPCISLDRRKKTRSRDGELNSAPSKYKAEVPLATTLTRYVCSYRNDLKLLPFKCGETEIRTMRMRAASRLSCALAAGREQMADVKLKCITSVHKQTTRLRSGSFPHGMDV